MMAKGEGEKMEKEDIEQLIEDCEQAEWEESIEYFELTRGR